MLGRSAGSSSSLRKTENDVRLAAIKAYQDFRQAEAAAEFTGQIAKSYAQVKLPAEPHQIIELAKTGCEPRPRPWRPRSPLRAKYTELMALLGH